MYDNAPLPGTFMIVGLFGFIATIFFWMYGRIGKTWGFTLAIFFAIVFIASLASLRPESETPPKPAKKK